MINVVYDDLSMTGYTLAFFIMSAMKERYRFDVDLDPEKANRKFDK